MFSFQLIISSACMFLMVYLESWNDHIWFLYILIVYIIKYPFGLIRINVSLCFFMFKQIFRIWYDTHTYKFNALYKYALLSHFTRFYLLNKWPLIFDTLLSDNLTSQVLLFLFKYTFFNILKQYIGLNVFIYKDK